MEFRSPVPAREDVERVRALDRDQRHRERPALGVDAHHVREPKEVRHGECDLDALGVTEDRGRQVDLVALRRVGHVQGRADRAVGVGRLGAEGPRDGQEAPPCTVPKCQCLSDVALKFRAL